MSSSTSARRRPHHEDTQSSKTYEGPLRACVTLMLCAVCVALGGQGRGLDPALLTKPPTDAWPTYHGDYSGRRYSTLTQINAQNVKQLTLAWVYRLNTSLGTAITSRRAPRSSSGAT